VPIANSGRAVHGQDELDYFFITAALLFISMISLFPIRNNDVWWHMAVGEQMVKHKHFITRDIFSFTTLGRAWAPQSYLAGILFYLVYLLAAAPGLILLRFVLVAVLFLMLVRIIGRSGISYAFASPFVILAALISQSRFIIRPHLFEYLFIVLLLGSLIAGRNKKGFGFYMPPALIQVLWVNMHPSYFLGPLVVLLFYFGEYLNAAASGRFHFTSSPWGGAVKWKPVLLLLLLMVVVSFINPSPYQFLTQPFNAQQRDLLRLYTLEWRSPFDPALKHALFHPYYEILLGLSLICLFAGIKRLHVSSLLIVGFFALLSLKAHRFRVEFAVVAVPLMLVQLKDSPLGEKLGGLISAKRGRARLTRGVFALAACALLIYSGRERVTFGKAVADRFPVRAFAFVRNENIAIHPFHSVAFGSFLLWDLYPDRKSFIDGRQIAVDVHSDFLLCQTGTAGFNRVVDKYNLDAFILPEPAKCDRGMLNTHHLLISSREWELVFINRNAFIYVRVDAVPAQWLRMKSYEFYNPLTYKDRVFLPDEENQLASELLRAAHADTLYLKPWMDLGTYYLKRTLLPDAREAFAMACKINPQSASAWHGAGMAAARSGEFERAIDAFAMEVKLSPNLAAPSFYLAKAYEVSGDRSSALDQYRRALAKDKSFSEAYVGMFNIYAAGNEWIEAQGIAEQFYETRPFDYRSSLQLAIASFERSDMNEALRRAKESEHIAEGKVEPHVLLGRIYLEMGDKESAKREALRALEIERNNGEAAEILRRLADQ
jgi:tetratricopeptide (TPR) repeat protein